MTAAPLRIDAERLWARLMRSAEMGAVGATGLCRLALSDADKAVRDWFAAEAASLGCRVRVDAAGNMFARYPGTEPELAPIALGSHLDTQPTGGRFDGILGVLAALEVVQTLQEANVVLRRPVEIVNWTNEEGSRFTPAMLGSAAFAGVLAPDEVDARTDADGRRFDAELVRIGYRGAGPLVRHQLAAYVELHIEQGPVLEAAGLEIGVVTGVQGIQWFDVVLAGESCHAGTTPMALRRDPMPALASFLAAVHEIGNSDPGRSLATVGVLRAEPGSRNTVPQAVRLSVDLRHPDAPVLEAMAAGLRRDGAAVAERHRVECTIETHWISPPVAFDPVVVARVRRAAEALGLSHREMVSGAGHDAVHLARVAPTAMIFVPCRDGISHNPRESITPRQAADGAQVLLRVVLDTP